MSPLLALLGGLVIGGASPAQAQLRTYSTAIHAEAVLAISEFFLEWQRLWRASALGRRAAPGSDTVRDMRLAYLHCHSDATLWKRKPPTLGATAASERLARIFAGNRIVESEHSAFATCPSWILSDGVPDALDEGEQRDGALVIGLRPAARAARERLVRTLDSAAAHLPGSGFLAGQLVRFQVEHGDIDGAARAARACRAEHWWCLALTGYVLDMHGASLQSEATYRAMHEAMRESVDSTKHCEWDDVRDLLTVDERDAYRTPLCADRSATRDTFWWLADPLWRETGNARWVAHQSRRVDIALRRALDADERYAWDDARGGDALARHLLRYGWPSYTWWDGRDTDDAHSQWLEARGALRVPPYTTFEYSVDRVHLVPTWRAVVAPLAAREADWELAQVAADGSPDPGWWAAELLRTPRRLVQLPEGQMALFRRETHIAAATAHRLRQPLLRQGNPTFDVMLLASATPGAADTLARRSAKSDATVVLRGTLSGTPTLLAVEALGEGASRVDARTRFAVQPPPMLRTMVPGEVAISDVAVLDPSSLEASRRVAGAALPSDDMLDHLLGSLSLDRSTRRVALYWETYGIASGDSVNVSVRVQGDADVGVMRRLGVALNVASDPNRTLGISWTEPNPQYQTRTLAGPIPVQQRSILLNLAQLAPGPYVMQVSVQRPGGREVTSQRRLVLLP